jgi:hypothetical protein
MSDHQVSIGSLWTSVLIAAIHGSLCFLLVGHYLFVYLPKKNPTVVRKFSRDPEMEALEEELEGLSSQERLQKEIRKQKRLAMIKFGQRLFIGFLGGLVSFLVTFLRIAVLMASGINAFVWSSFFVAGTMALIVKFAATFLEQQN